MECLSHIYLANGEVLMHLMKKTTNSKSALNTVETS